MGWFMSTTFFGVALKHFSDLFFFVLSPALTLGMINRPLKSSIILNTPHFPTHDKIVFLYLKFATHKTRLLAHVADSHEQKVHPHVAYPSKWLTKCFSFPQVCAITPRHDWELKSWRENFEILTYFRCPRPEIVSIALLSTGLALSWGLRASW